MKKGPFSHPLQEKGAKLGQSGQTRLSLAHRASPLQVKSFLTIVDEGRSKKKVKKGAKRYNLQTRLAAFTFIILFLNQNSERCLSTNSMAQEACKKKNPGTLNGSGT